MADCVFCKIIQGEIPCSKIYENDYALAFLDINPMSKGHVVIVPKTHYRWIWDIEGADGCEFFKATRKVAKHLQDVTKDEFVFSHTYGADVEHAHLHLIPNWNSNYNKQFSRFIAEMQNSSNSDKEDFENISNILKLPEK